MDTEQNQTPRPAPSMDIQPPRPSYSSTNPERPTVSAAPAQTEDEVTAATEQPADTKPLIAQATAATAHPTDKAPVGAIVAALVIAVGLAALSVFAYMKTSDKPANNAKSGTQSVNQSAAPAAITGKDVDTATKGIDETMGSTNDTADFDSNSLSDASLGM